MSPGFFLCLAENTGDGFAYVVLPGKEYKDISIHHNPVTLVRCVVRGRDLSSVSVPSCIQDDDEFKIYNSQGIELVGDELLEADPEDQTSEESVASEEPTPSPAPTTPTSALLM